MNSPFEVNTPAYLYFLIVPDVQFGSSVDPVAPDPSDDISKLPPTASIKPRTLS